ncbi:hypothetical protein [Nostoc sp.]|uniref:hypothetical protein n=1 Tax=Nostoc sp. TaxID=1180 RepID=UPI002FFCA079
MSETYSFEVLCVDPQNKTVLQESQNVIHVLFANSTLWQSPSLTGISQNLEIRDEDISLTVAKLEIESTSESLLKRAFSVRCSGSYERLEKVRLPVCQYLKSQGFEFVYILLDEISEFIAQQIYPSINRVENRLRKYIIKFFVTKLGPNWWEVTADAEMKKKASQRKNNETIFGSVIDNKVYLIDFGELGKIVYQQSSGYISREDIIRKVLEIESSENAVDRLKEELQSNYTKFFRETFKDQDFQHQWEKLEKLRHKVAHNNLFTNDDLQNCQRLATSLLKTIEDANLKIETIAFSADDLETIKSNIIEVADPYKVISEEELLNHLRERQEHYFRTNGFVGLASFVKNYLGLIGYDYSASYSVIKQLEQQEKAEVYHIDGPNGFRVAAVRLKENRSFQS